jgi:hypothetical protein
MTAADLEKIRREFELNGAISEQATRDFIAMADSAMQYRDRVAGCADLGDYRPLIFCMLDDILAGRCAPVGGAA